MRMEDNVKSSRNISAIDHPKEESAPRARVGKGKELESPLDELFIGTKDLHMRFAKLKKIESSSVQKPTVLACRLPLS